MSQCREPVYQVVRHVQKLKLVGSGGEGRAHDEVHLHGGEHGAQGVQLGSELSVCAAVLHVQVGEECVVRLLDGVVQRLVGRHDTLPLAVHVSSKFFQKCAKKDDSIPQRILKFFN